MSAAPSWGPRSLHRRHLRPRAANSEAAAAPVPTPPRRRDAVRIPDPVMRVSRPGRVRRLPAQRDPEPGRCPTPAILAGRAVRKPQPPLTIWLLPLVYRFPNCVLKKLAPKFKGSGKCVWACDIHRVPVWGCCRPPSFPISLGQTPWQDPLQDPTPRVQCRREQAPIPGSGTEDRREMRGVGCGGGGGQAGG